MHSRARIAAPALAVSLIFVVAASLTIGSVGLSLAEVASSLVGNGDAQSTFVVVKLRLPRVIMCLLAGCAFGVAGALCQALFANPLASPDLIGITSGSSAAAVAAILLFDLSGFAVSAAALVGGLVVAGCVYVLAWRSGVSGHRFVVIGVAVAFVVHGLLGFLLTRADVRDAQSALVWMVGSVGGTRWIEVGVAAASIGLLLPCVALLAKPLRMLQLGDDTARALGLRVEGARAAVLVVAVALAAGATAAVGPIAFVAFVCGPIARRLFPGGGLALIGSGAVGAALVAAADLVAQHGVPGGVQLPVGIVTGLVGGPYLLWLLATQRAQGES